MSNYFINLGDWGVNLIVFFFLILFESIYSFCVGLKKFRIIMGNFGVVIIGKFIYCMGF